MVLPCCHLFVNLFSLQYLRDLYIEIIEPLGHKAKEKNDDFVQSYAQMLNKFTLQFATEFCDDGKINWEKIVKFNSSEIKPAKIQRKN